MANFGFQIQVDLLGIRTAAESIASKTKVPVIAVVKANAYGCGARDVVEALADVVDGFYVFDLTEAIEAETARTGKPALALRGESMDPEDWLRAQTRPAVWDIDRATRLRKAHPVFALDTGQQRFAAGVDSAQSIIEAGLCDEAFTHATRLDQVEQLKALRPMKLHAAGTALLDQPDAWLDAVRPGLALYDENVRVTSRLIEARRANGPAGYTGFRVHRFGVIPMGYSNGLRAGPCLVDGQRTRILEVGMQSAFIELPDRAKVGDEVVLLGDGLHAKDLASAWNCSPQEVLVSITRDK